MKVLSLRIKQMKKKLSHLNRCPNFMRSVRMHLVRVGWYAGASQQLPVTAVHGSSCLGQSPISALCMAFNLAANSVTTPVATTADSLYTAKYTAKRTMAQICIERLRHASDPIFWGQWVIFRVRGLFQGPGPLPMASARRAIGISLIESFWRALGVGPRYRNPPFLHDFCDFSPRMPTRPRISFSSRRTHFWLAQHDCTCSACQI